ncbi:MAG: hypothetical protein Q9186_005261 [Xanthomendoza sp. 1 TL-2023]
MSYTFDHGRRLRAIEVYQTAIQLMYDTAQYPWDEAVDVVKAEEIEGYNVAMMILNPQPTEAQHQLRVSHCITAIYRAIVIMTDGMIFCQLDAQVLLFSDRIGELFIGSSKRGTLVSAGRNTTVAVMEPDITALDAPHADPGPRTGTIHDVKNPFLSITYHVLGRFINPKEISLVILDALASAAPFSKSEQCKNLEALSPDGGAAIIIESLTTPLFTYEWATRSLKLLYQQIIVPYRRWGDIYLEIKANDQVIGELRMLKINSVEDRKKVAVDTLLLRLQQLARQKRNIGSLPRSAHSQNVGCRGERCNQFQYLLRETTASGQNADAIYALRSFLRDSPFLDTSKTSVHRVPQQWRLADIGTSVAQWFEWPGVLDNCFGLHRAHG